MKLNQKPIEDMSYTEIFQEISKRQVLALMFHDSMYDLYDFLNLPGFKCWHKHQYLSESKEYLNTKHYFMSTHNKLLDTNDLDQFKSVIPTNWYGYTRFDLNSQSIKQYVESSFNEYRKWEEDTKKLYEELSQALFDLGYISDSEKANGLIQDVTEELKMIYKIMLKLKAANYDVIYILDMQHWFHKKYK